ncbi:MAG: phage tail sheath family protein, partial [Desulfobacterales bacterium]|nr:phage tail sheath family protein [Desulfobacterales bacterium]
MATYRTPGVYMEEVSTLPPSVSEVATAIPAFIGYTEKSGPDLKNKPVRIDAMLDYTERFGGADQAGFTVKLEQEHIKEIETTPPKYLMHHDLSMYFKNGGGPCYIVSVGDYSGEKAKKEEMLKGLNALKTEDEPTLILLVDAVNLAPDDYYEVCQASLKQCSDLKDRFAIFDVLKTDADAGSFRDKMVGDLKYGAAYHPYLTTTLNYAYTDKGVSVTETDADGGGAECKTDENGIKIIYTGAEKTRPEIKAKISGSSSISENIEFKINESGDMLTIT